MPVPPNKKKLAKIDASLVESGQLKIGISCIPVSMKWRIKGEIRVIEAQRVVNSHWLIFIKVS